MCSIRAILAVFLLALLAPVGAAFAQESIPTRLLIRATDAGQERAVGRLSDAGYSVAFVHEYPVFMTMLYAFDAPLAGADIPIVRTLLDDLIADSTIETGDFDVPMAVETGIGQTGSLWVTGMTESDFAQQYGRLVTGSYVAADRATGLGVKVAIIDSGLTDGDTIARRSSLSYGYSVTGGVATQGNIPRDVGDSVGPNVGVGHGTFVSALVACVAPSAKHLHIKVLDDEGQCFLADVIAALEASINEYAHVANMSLIPSQPTPTLTHAISTARKHGIIVVASAGNDNPTVNPYQGCEPDLIQVGATNHLDVPFSGATPAWIDIFAPGASNVPTTGLPVASEAVIAPIGVDANQQPIYAAATGTSFAAAFVSGAAAAYRAANADWPNAQVSPGQISSRFVNAARNSATPIPTGSSGAIKRLRADALVAGLPRVARCSEDPVAEEDAFGNYVYVINEVDLACVLTSWNPLGSDPRRIVRANLSLDPENRVDAVDVAIILSLWDARAPEGCP